MPHRKRHEAPEAGANRKRARLARRAHPGAVYRHGHFLPRTSSTSAGASLVIRHVAVAVLDQLLKRHEANWRGSRYTLRQRTGSGIRIWSETKTLGTARKHRKGPTPPISQNTRGSHYFAGTWTPLEATSGHCQTVRSSGKYTYSSVSPPLSAWKYSLPSRACMNSGLVLPPLLGSALATLVVVPASGS